MGARGVGADGGDQGRPGQAARVQHRACGGGAEHHHVRLGHGGFEAGGDLHARVLGAQLRLGLGIPGQGGGMDGDALPVAQAFHVVQVSAGHRAAADHREGARLLGRQGLDRHRRSGGGAGGGQLAGIAEQQRLAAVHGHQQGPGGDQGALGRLDIGRGLDPVYALLGQHPEVVDEVAGGIGKLHQLLGRLQGFARSEVQEHATHGLVHIHLLEQTVGFGLLDDNGRGAGHGDAPRGWNKLFVHIGLSSINRQGPGVPMYGNGAWV
ncbi:hypothetical protein D9M68_658830 [compost metagenome]